MAESSSKRPLSDGEDAEVAAPPPAPKKGRTTRGKAKAADTTPEVPTPAPKKAKGRASRAKAGRASPPPEEDESAPTNGKEPMPIESETAPASTAVAAAAPGPAGADGWRWVGTLMLWESPDIVHSDKIASFDYDGCLADTSLFKHGPDAWKLLYPDSIPRRMQELHRLGYKLVIFTNQAAIGKATASKEKTIAEKKGRLIGFRNLIGLPFQIFVATAKTDVRDDFRKPATGMWRFLQDHCNGGIPIDMTKSFFCGDAAGRPGRGKKKKDHGDTDKGFAQNVGVRFYTEDEFFEHMQPLP